MHAQVLHYDTINKQSLSIQQMDRARDVIKMKILFKGQLFQEELIGTFILHALICNNYIHMH